MLDACDAWLRDPADPEKYTLTPRSTEVEIVWQDGPRRRKAKLGELLERIAPLLPSGIELVEAKVTDPRRLLLDAVATLKPVVELLGKASGQIKAEPLIQVLNLSTHPDFARLLDGA